MAARDPVEWVTHPDPAFNKPEVILDKRGFTIWVVNQGDPNQRVYLTGGSPAYSPGNVVQAPDDWSQPRGDEVGGVVVRHGVRTDDAGLIHVHLVLHPTTLVEPDWSLAEERSAAAEGGAEPATGDGNG